MTSRMLVFVFAKTCGACVQYKANGHPAVVEHLKRKGIPYREITFETFGEKLTNYGFGPNVSNAVTWYPYIMVVEGNDRVLAVFNANFNKGQWEYARGTGLHPNPSSIETFYNNSVKAGSTTVAAPAPAPSPATATATATASPSTSSYNRPTGFIPTSACSRSTIFKSRLV